jgi:hypothetical protein
MEETNPSPKPEKKTVEVRYEIQMGKLAAIMLIGIIVAIGAGFFLGSQVGFATGFSQVTVEKPAYCTSDVYGGKVVVKCNELGNVSLDSLCQWASPELREKVKLVLITGDE